MAVNKVKRACLKDHVSCVRHSVFIRSTLLGQCVCGLPAVSFGK